MQATNPQDHSQVLKKSAAEVPNYPERAVAVMAILFLVFFLGLSDNQMLSPLLPLIADEFNLGAGDVGKLLAPSYAVAAACAALFVGPASDRFGRRKFLMWASLLFGISLVSVVVIKDIRLLTCARFITGFAAGVFSTCSIAYVGDYFPYQRRGTAMSVVQAGYFAALVIGVFVGSALAQWHGWRLSFNAFGLLSFVAFFLIMTLLPDDGQRPAPDRSTAIVRKGFSSMAGIFRSSELAAAVGSSFFVSCGFMGFLLYISSWLITSFGLTTTQVSSVFVVVGISSLLGSFVAGPIADRLGKRRLSIVGSIVLAGALMIIPMLDWSLALFAGFLVASVAYAFRLGPLQALATELVPASSRGALVAARNTASQIGIAVSAAVSGLLYDRYGYVAVGLFNATMTLAAAVCIYFIKEPGTKTQSLEPAS